MDHVRDYHAHSSVVSSVKFCPENKWLLSAGKDR